MKENFTDSYKEFIQFISKNIENFGIRINQSEADSDIDSYKIQIYLRDNSLVFKPNHFTIEFSIVINFKDLNKAYDELEIDVNSKILKGHFHEHNGIYKFMERYWDKVILHLKEFNQDEDNYIEIGN